MRIYYGATAGGLESALRDELQRMGARVLEEEIRGGLLFQTDADPRKVARLRSLDTLYAFVAHQKDIPVEREAGIAHFKALADQVDWRPALELHRRWQRASSSAPGQQLPPASQAQEGEARAGGDDRPASVEAPVGACSCASAQEMPRVTFRVTCDRVCVKMSKHKYTSADAAAAIGDGLHERFGWPANMRRFELEVMAWIWDSHLLLAFALLYSEEIEEEKEAAAAAAEAEAEAAAAAEAEAAPPPVSSASPSGGLRLNEDEIIPNFKEEGGRAALPSAAIVTGPAHPPPLAAAAAAAAADGADDAAVPAAATDAAANGNREIERSGERSGAGGPAASDPALLAGPGPGLDGASWHAGGTGERPRMGKDNARNRELQRARGEGVVKQGELPVQARYHHAHRQLYSKRSYRRALVRTSLKPSTAYALLHLAAVEPGHIILDPMCGSGTIPLEAADWLGCQVASFGGDVDPDALQAMSVNAAALLASGGATSQDGADGRRRQECDMVRWSATALPLVDGCIDRVICDMPFGVRCGNFKTREQLLPKVAQEVARVLRPGTGRAVLMGLGKSLRVELQGRLLPVLSILQHLHVEMEGMRVEVYVLQRTTAVLPPPKPPALSRKALRRQRENAPGGEGASGETAKVARRSNVDSNVLVVPSP